MARDIRTRLIADDEMSPSFRAAGRAATKMALDVEGAALKVEKATKAAAAAEQRFGKESVQAREAAHRLAVADLELAAANDRVKASAEDSSKSVSKGNGALKDVVKTAEKGNGALRGMAMTLGKVGATAAATASLVGPLVTGLVGVGHAAAVAAREVVVAGKATLAAAQAMAPATAALPAFAAGFLLLRGTVLLAAPAIVKAFQPVTDAFVGTAGKVGGKKTLIGGLREDVGALAARGLPSLAQGFLKVNFPAIRTTMLGIATQFNHVLLAVGRWVNSRAGQSAVGAILKGTLDVTKQLASILPGVVISFGNMVGRAAGPGFQAIGGLGPMLDRAAGAVKRLFDSTSGADVGNGFQAIGTTFGRIKGAVEGAWEKLSAFGHMVLDVGNWMSDNQGKVKAWSDGLAVVGIGLGIIATGPVAVLIGSLTLLVNHWDAVKDATGRAVGAMQAFDQQNRVSEQSTSLWSQAVSGLVGWFREWLTPTLEWIGRTVMPLLRNAFDDAKMAIRDLSADSNIWVGALKILGAVLIGIVVAAVVVVVGTISALAAAFRGVAWLVHNVLVPAFRTMVGYILDTFGAIIHGADDAFGWIPGVGDKLHSAARAFDRFRDEVNRSLGGIKDQHVTVGATIKFSSGAGTASGGLKVGMRAAGGPVTGPGGPRDDAIPAMLSNGEYVVNAAATSRHRGLLEAINGRGYAAGGLVMSTSTTGLAQVMAAERKALLAAAKQMAPSFTSGGGGGGSIPIGGLSAAERWIIMHESGGRTTAQNPTSTAFGLGQLLLANRQHYGAILGVSPGTTDMASQLAMFRMYVRDRYGNAENAQAFWQSHGWYDQGGIARGAGLMAKRTSKPERVLSPAQTVSFDRLTRVLARGGGGGDVRVTVEVTASAAAIEDRIVEATKAAVRHGRLSTAVIPAGAR